MTKPIEYTVGMKLWIKPERRINAGLVEVQVVSVGRVWVTLDKFRWKLRVGTRYLDCGDRGYVYTSPEEWAGEMELTAAWGQLSREFRGYTARPEGVTVEDIQQIRKLLKCSD